MQTRLVFFFAFVFFAQLAMGQNGFTYRQQYYIFSTPTRIDVASNTQADFDPKLVLVKPAAPAPQNDTRFKKQQLDELRAKHVAKPQTTSYQKTGAPEPTLLTNFNGNITQGTPNDNDIAVSKGGKIISVVNTNLNFFSDSIRVSSRSLAAFANALGSLNRTFDPRVIYDPKSDRFIVVFLQGSTSADTRIIVGFSDTNDPVGTWNFYQIPGNITGDSSWSDYPIISISDEDLFITVNRVRDNTPWQSGFITSYIWQVSKASGYAGDSLRTQLYDQITYNNRSIWSVCPVKGGSTTYGPNMWFLSQRPSDLQNDTVFLHEITNTLASGNATLKQIVLRTNKTYGLQPNAIQPNGKKLQTNDARVLSACYENGYIHYVGNTIDTSNFAPAVYYGVIGGVWGNNPQIEGNIISYDTMDIGYPSIAYMGGGSGDNSMLITFSHVSPLQFPGTSAVYVDRFGNVSNPVLVKAGEGSIALLGDSLDRWGDYTGNQTQYAETGVCWINGSYGTANGQNRTWIAKLKSNDPLLQTQQLNQVKTAATIYPNPAQNYITLEIEATQSSWVLFSITDANGKLVAPLLRDRLKAGKSAFSFQTDGLPAGNYFLTITENDQLIQNKPFVVVR